MQKKAFTWPHEVDNVKKQNKFMWSSRTLLDSFIPLYEDLLGNPSSYAFRNEVNPDAMGIPEYKVIIKFPMALDTIKEKLISGKYEEPWDVVNDFWLIFNNAMLFNKPSTNVYKECVKLLEYFKAKINPLMKKLGFCCGIKYTFEPQSLACNLCDPDNPLCSILKGKNYKYFKTSEEDGIQICIECFDRCPNSFTIPSESSRQYLKSQFSTFKNDILVDESFISCSNCCRKWHTICAVHISTTDNPFLCSLCLDYTKSIQKELSSERIPTTDLSEFIEHSVNKMLFNKCRSFDKVNVRVLADSRLKLQVKPEIIEHYRNKNVDSFYYRNKAIYAFQKIDGHDVVFFALYTQEYDDTCPSPNNRRIYISYLDSVHYFQPRELKTDVYHSILISYFDYCKQQQYLTAHLWSCPPGSGDDYVFHQHPIDQKVPKKKRLLDWYKGMLDKAVRKNVVIKYMNIHEYLLENRVSDPTEIPYFEGDFWPNAICEMLTNTDDSQLYLNPKRQKLVKKNIDTAKEVKIKMLQMTKKFNEEFVVIILNKQENINAPIINGTNRNNYLKNTVLVEARDSILYFCREYNLEFSTLRRAKFTTLRIIDEIFRDNQKETYDCDVCKKSKLSDRYTCVQCLDFDLCPVCYDKVGHEHEMERKIQSISEIRMGEMLSLLDEAIRCKECRKNSCVMMKNLLLHAQRCSLSYEECNDCYKYTVLMVNHVNYCKDPKCRIVFCREKREKDKRRDSQILLKRRYNEILRYQATKQSFGSDEIKVKFESKKETTITEEVKERFYDRDECKKMFMEFLKKNPENKNIEELRQQFLLFLNNDQGLIDYSKIQSNFTQLIGKSIISNQDTLKNIPSKQDENIKKPKSDYFIKSSENYENNTSQPLAKPLPKNHVAPVENLKNFSFKPQLMTIIKSEPVKTQNYQQVQSKSKKIVQISNQNN